MSKGGQPPLACQIWVQIPGRPTAQWGATGSYRHRWEQPMGEKEKGDFNVAWKSEALAALQYSSKSIMAATQMPSCRRIWELIAKMFLLTAAVVRHRGKRHSQQHCFVLAFKDSFFQRALHPAGPTLIHTGFVAEHWGTTHTSCYLSKKAAAFCPGCNSHMAFKATQKQSAL